MRIHRKIKPFFSDSRGNISHILPDETPVTSVVLITSKKGAVRANHYHKKDTHHVYMIKGKMKYTYKKNSSGSAKRDLIISEGEIITTPPLTTHAMEFLEDSTFIALTTEARDRKRYEEDTVRVDFVKNE